jgi:hypothetical protein
MIASQIPTGHLLLPLSCTDEGSEGRPDFFLVPLDAKTHRRLTAWQTLAPASLAQGVFALDFDVEAEGYTAYGNTVCDKNGPVRERDYSDLLAACGDWCYVVLEEGEQEWLGEDHAPDDPADFPLLRLFAGGDRGFFYSRLKYNGSAEILSQSFNLSDLVAGEPLPEKAGN